MRLLSHWMADPKTIGMGRAASLLAGVLLGAAALTASACASSHNAARAAASSCTPPGARTIARGSRARVVKVGHTFYGCLEREGKLVSLGGDACLGRGAGSVSQPRLAGDTVGYALMTCGIDTGGSEVISTDLRSNTVLRRGSANLLPSGPESYGSVTDLVVRADGALGWIARSTSIIGRGSTTEVDRLDRRGSRTLDRGAGIAVGSCACRGHG